MALDTPANAISQVQQSLAHLARRNSEMMRDASLQARDASLAFVNLRLERDGQALGKCWDCRGIAGLVGLQQEWLRDLFQDYADQNIRVVTALHDTVQKALAGAAGLADEVQQAGEEMTDAAAEGVEESQDMVADQVDAPTQGTQATQH